MNPYNPPSLKASEPDEPKISFWILIRELLYPNLKCKRIGHDFEYDDFVWKRTCKRCDLTEGYRA